MSRNLANDELERRWRRAGHRPPGLIIACGALVREIRDVLIRNGLAHTYDVRAVPSGYHNRPERIAPAVERLVNVARDHYSTIFVAYAECGTQGALDELLRRERLERLPGAHCYALFTGVAAFAAQQQDDVTSFYLTDFLARHFDALVWRGLGLDRHPELRDLYFGNYSRVVYLSQLPDVELIAQAAAAARRLGLDFEHRPVGYGDLQTTLMRLPATPADPATHLVPND